MYLLTRRHLLALATGTALNALAHAARSTPRPTQEEGFVRISGIDQWVAIRGRDRSRLAILFLHGGPGEAQSPLLSVFAPWEELYVVAQWDQRGSGKTFEKVGVSTPNMTLEQLTQDTIEVAQYVLSRLGVRKLILVGHSWGSILGLCAARSRPEVFHALVGTAQVVSGKKTLESVRLSALARAQAAGDTQAVAELNSYSAVDLFTDAKKREIVFRWQTPF